MVDRQPVLTGNLVELRPTVEADWAGLYAVASDPEIWAMHPFKDRWQEPVFRAYFDGALASGGGLTIRDKASGAIIGASRYDMHDPVRDEIEIGWTFLSRDYWGGPTNREVKRLMLDHIHAQVRTAIFVIGEHNLRSRRAIEKIGGTLLADRRDRGDGGLVPGHVFYAIPRP